MRKNKQNKEIKRNQLFKYIQPSQPPNKNHTKSLMELEPNLRYQPSARANKENHHSSLCNNENKQIQNYKSNSLKKFLSMFGNSNSNPILQSTGSTTRRDEKLSARNSGRQVFTCNIKNMNVNMNHSKDKEITEYKSLALKKDKIDKTIQLKKDEEELTQKLRKQIENYKQRQTLLQKQKATLECENAALQSQIGDMTKERQLTEERARFRERQLQRKIQSLERGVKKQRCREHELVIQSLKKVINEQLRKIIELEKLKIEREEIQKLEQRINKNISNFSNQNSQQKLKLLQTASRQMHKKGYGYINIEDCATPSQSEQGGDGCEPIEEASQEEQQSGLKTEGDSILDEVDRYLSQWRGTK